MLSAVTCVFSCSVITDVLWLKLSQTAVKGAAVNRNTSKYRQHTKRLVQSPYHFRIASFPWWFLIRYQFLSLEWP